MLGPSIGHLGNVGQHLFPNLVGDGDPVAVQVHRKGRDDMRLSPVANGRRQGLPGQHMRAVQLAVDHPIQQHFPVGLGFEGDKKPLIKEVALLIGNGERGHVCQLDKTEGQHVLFKVKQFSESGAGHHGRGRKAKDKVFHGWSF